MTELTKCRCGAEAEWQISTDGKVGRWCRRCGIHGPWCDSEELMDAAWNSLMRPRPVAEWVAAEGLRGDGPHGFVGSLWLGQVALGYVSVHRAHGIVDHAAQCHLDGKGEYFRDPNPASARAWLEARVRAAGFDVREE